MTSSDERFVSCLMVTLPVPGRLPFFKRSVAQYCAQTYPRKELVVVTDGARHEQQPLARHLESLGRDDIRFVPLAGTLTLGALRNRACEQARGALFCQWDDDDLHHPRRVEEQVRALTAEGARCVYLQDVMQYVVESGDLFWTNWRQTEMTAHPGTLLCARDAQPSYPQSGPDADRGEDGVVCRELRERPGFSVLAQKPYLYVYVTHGANKWNGEHHAMLVRELAISRGLLLRREQMLREGLAPFALEGHVVQGSNGPAFTLTATRSS